MTKSEWIENLARIKEKVGIQSLKYKAEYLKYYKKYGNPGRGLNRPDINTNGKKKRNTKLPFGTRSGNPEDV